MTARRPPDVDDLARRLPRRAPSPERAAAMRRALLDAADLPAPSRWPGVRGWAIGGAIAAAAAVLVMVALHAIAPLRVDPAAAPAQVAASAAPPAGPSAPAPAAPSRGLGAAHVVPARPRAPAERVHAVAASSSERLAEGVNAVTATGPVQMTRGETTITAPPGARFEIDIRDDQVRFVTVTAGWVVVASARSAATVVIERQSWILDPPPAEPPPAPASRPPPPAPTAPARPVITASRSAPSRVVAPAPGTPSSREIRPAAPAPPPAPRSAEPAREVATPRAAEPEPPAEVVDPTTTAPASGLATASTAEADAAARAVAAEREFSDGLHALLGGNARAATAPLDRACSAATGSQEDACYWAAVAWLRSGERVRARRALADVLTRWPRSSHAGEASVALGWLQLEVGDRAGARAWFAAAANDPMPSVRADAARGLTAAQ